MATNQLAKCCRARRACDLTAVCVIPSSKNHTEGEGQRVQDIIEGERRRGELCRMGGGEK